VLLPRATELLTIVADDRLSTPSPGQRAQDHPVDDDDLARKSDRSDHPLGYNTIEVSNPGCSVGDHRQLSIDLLFSDIACRGRSTVSSLPASPASTDWTQGAVDLRLSGSQDLASSDTLQTQQQPFSRSPIVATSCNGCSRTP
jgi:hypothetical protein